MNRRQKKKKFKNALISTRKENKLVTIYSRSTTLNEYGNTEIINHRPIIKIKKQKERNLKSLT